MPRKPVVFVPGFPASHLIDRAANRPLFPPRITDLVQRKDEIVQRLQGPDDPDSDDGVDAGDPIRYAIELPWIDLQKEAQSLYELLSSLGYDTNDTSEFRPIGWDWRLPIDHAETQASVVDAIDQMSNANNSKVVLVVHSTGGLVVRALLESQPLLSSRIERIIALGVPWLGVLVSFQHVALGKAVKFGPLPLLSKGDSRKVMRRAHAAFDLFPPDPSVLVDGDGPIPLFSVDGNVSSPLVDRGWLKGPNSAAAKLRMDASLQKWGTRKRWFALDDAHAVPVTNIAGWGTGTLTASNYDSASDDLTFDATYDGDGTVPRRSAAWLEHPVHVRTFFVPVGVYNDQIITQYHSTLWNTPPGRALCRRFLLGEPPEKHLWAAADADAAIDRNRDVVVRITAADEEGRPLAGARARLVLPGTNAELDLSQNVRGEITVPRAAMHLPNVGTHFFRFEIAFRWSGSAGEVKRPILVEV